MEIAARLLDLKRMHPRLLWDDISAALVAILGDSASRPVLSMELIVRDMPGFGSESMQMAINLDGISASHVARLRRTFESSRLVELAGIAIAGLGLYYAGGHEIRDVALRGSAADYLVDDANHLLEVAGRSRASDASAAWEKRRERFTARRSGGFYICVVEFETPAGQLAFFE